jgi:hypothetical protein
LAKPISLIRLIDSVQAILDKIWDVVEKVKTKQFAVDLSG